MAKRVVVFGGSGFVGSLVLHHLAEGLGVVGKTGPKALAAVTRSGARPVHLEGVASAEQVEWMQGDALDAGSCEAAVKDAYAVVISVGSPPVPTWSDEEMEAQRRFNGQTNVNVIKAASQAGSSVQRVVVMGATVPSWAPAGYAAGKADALDAAKGFGSEAGRFSAVLQPSGIYGTRHTAGGAAIPLWLGMAPVAAAQRALEGVVGDQRYGSAIAALGPLGVMLEPLVSADCVAKAAAELALLGHPDSQMPAARAAELEARFPTPGAHVVPNRALSTWPV